MDKQHRILVIGGTGLIGTQLVTELLESNYTTAVMARGVEPVAATPSSNLSFKRFDIVQNELPLDYLSGFDTVVHLAWTTVPIVSEADPVKDINDNLTSTIRIARRCEQAGVRRLIFLSSGGTVYGPSSLALTESNPPSPICMHGCNKLAAERFLLAHATTGELEVCIVRPSNVYGREFVGSRPQGLIEVAITKALRGEPLQMWDSASVVRDYVYVSDVARALLLLVQLPATPKIVNISTGIGTSNQEIIEMIRSVTGSPLKVVFGGNENLFNVETNILANDLLKAVTGWSPKIGIEAGVKSSFDSIKAYLNGNNTEQKAIGAV